MTTDQVNLANTIFELKSEFDEYYIFNEMLTINMGLDFIVECKIIPHDVSSQEYNNYGVSKR